MGYGAGGYIGFAKETTWGTAVAPANYSEGISESLITNFDRFSNINIVGGRYYEAEDNAGTQRNAGDVVVPVNPEVLGFFLRGGLGIYTQSTVLSGFLHTAEFIPNGPGSEFSLASPNPPYTFEIFRDTTSAYRYAGVNVGRMEFSMQPNQELRLSMGVFGKSVAWVAKSTATFPGSPIKPFLSHEASLSIDGAGTALIEALTISYDSQLEGIAALNATQEIAKIRRTGPQLVRVSGTLDFETDAEWNKFKNQSAQAFSVNFLKPGSFSLLFTLPKVVYTAFPIGAAGRDRITVGFEGMGQTLGVSSAALIIKLTTVKSGWG